MFFTVVIGVSEHVPSDILTAMFAWLAVKMAANWNRDQSSPKAVRAGAVSAALAGLVSMLFAFIGGLLCRGSLWLSFGL